MRFVYLFFLPLIFGINIFISPSSSDWSNGKNWSYGRVPGCNDTVWIDNKVVIVLENSSVRNLILSGRTIFSSYGRLMIGERLVEDKSMYMVFERVDVKRIEAKDSTMWLMGGSIYNRKRIVWKEGNDLIVGMDSRSRMGDMENWENVTLMPGGRLEVDEYWQRGWIVLYYKSVESLAEIKGKRMNVGGSLDIKNYYLGAERGGGCGKFMVGEVERYGMMVRDETGLYRGVQVGRDGIGMCFV